MNTLWNWSISWLHSRIFATEDSISTMTKLICEWHFVSIKNLLCKKWRLLKTNFPSSCKFLRESHLVFLPNPISNMPPPPKKKKKTTRHTPSVPSLIGNMTHLQKNMGVLKINKLSVTWQVMMTNYEFNDFIAMMQRLIEK